MAPPNSPDILGFYADLRLVHFSLTTANTDGY